MKERLITGFIGGALFLGLLWLGGPWYSALIYVLAFGSVYEFIRMRPSAWRIPMGVIAFLFVAIVLSMQITTAAFIVLLWVTVFALFFLSVVSKNKLTVEDIGYLLIGLVYISIGFYFMKLIRLDHGLEWTLLTVALVWSTDTGAYFSGMAFGRTKLWPAISPKKTIEGSLGGTVFAVVISVLFYYFGTEIPQLLDAVIIGLVVSIVAQIGDLIESAIKRTFDVKDSGRILPGHGGFLDRFDSMIAAFPVMSYLITWLT